MVKVRLRGLLCFVILRESYIVSGHGTGARKKSGKSFMKVINKKSPALSIVVHVGITRLRALNNFY